MKNSVTKLLCSLILAFPVMFSSCKNNNSSQSKSFVGLEADLDGDIAKGAAPSYVLLQDWFNGKIPVNEAAAQAGTIKYKVHNGFKDSNWKAMPDAYRKGMFKYFQQQLGRVAAFQKAEKNPDELKKLLALESAEMYDILRALIDPDYRPISGDLLAHLISQPKIRSYTDRFSVELLEKLFQKSKRKLVANLAVERDNFSGLMVKTFLTNSGSNAKFVSQLESNCTALKNFIVALGEKPSGDCKGSVSLQLSASSKSPASALAEVKGGGIKFSDMYSGLLSASGPAGGGGKPNLSIFAGKDASAGDPAAGGSGGGTTPPPTTPDPSTPTPTTPPTPTPDPLPSGGGGGGLGGLGEIGGLLQNLLSMLGINWSDIASQLGVDMGLASDQMLASTAQTLPPKPAFDCVSKGYKGMQLILCQRYFSVLPKLESTYKQNFSKSKGSSDGFSLDSARPYSYYLIANHYSPVQNQGGEGACTAYGFSHSAEATLSAMGIKFRVNAADLWNKQGHDSTTTAPIEASRSSDFGGKRLAEAKRLDSVADIKASINRGHAVYMGSQTGEDWYNPRGTMSCGQGGAIGHAYSAQGYDDEKQVLIIKNSWGDSWGEEGYFYLPYKCLDIPGFLMELREISFN